MVSFAVFLFSFLHVYSTFIPIVVTFRSENITIIVVRILFLPPYVPYTLVSSDVAVIELQLVRR